MEPGQLADEAYAALLVPNEMEGPSCLSSQILPLPPEGWEGPLLMI